MATAVTVVALPALWLANRDDSAAPNVATVGVEVGAADPTDEPATTAAGAPAATAAPNPAPAPPAPAGDSEPVFLDGPAADPPSVAQVAVPAPSGESITMSATYNSTLPRTVCLTPGITSGLQATVVNLDNNRSVTCETVLANADQGDALVVHTDVFRELADLTDAPIAVDVRL